MPQHLFAQAGSAGGSVGKTDKSASGSEAGAPAHPAAKSAHHAIAKAEPTASSGCGKIAGTWTWIFGTTTVFKADGSARNSSGITSNGTCKDGDYTFPWSNGVTDHMTLSSDGAKLDVVNNVAHFTATRF